MLRIYNNNNSEMIIIKKAYDFELRMLVRLKMTFALSIISRGAESNCTMYFLMGLYRAGPIPITLSIDISTSVQAQELSKSKK